jgi:formylglycine-generating enzyme required for sulfatase activity
MGDTAGTWSLEPLSETTVGGFYLSTTELTQDEYLRFCEETLSHYPAWTKAGRYDEAFAKDKYYTNLVGPGKEANPILGVSWYDAVAYCNWRSAKEGLAPAYAIDGNKVSCDWGAKGYRLPTEAEWEYAAKAGGAGQYLPYAGSARAEEVAWFYNNCEGSTHPVGKKMPNGFGLYDLSGNAFEWCWDWFGPDPSGTRTDPRGPDSGEQRAIRGGSFLGSYWTVRACSRSCDYPGSTEYNVGFRLARSE